MESNKQNNLENKIDTETWNMEQTDSCQREGERGSWMKERKESAKEHKGITHGHRQLCGDGQREGEFGTARRGQMGA